MERWPTKSDLEAQVARFVTSLETVSEQCLRSFWERDSTVPVECDIAQVTTPIYVSVDSSVKEETGLIIIRDPRWKTRKT